MHSKRVRRAPSALMRGVGVVILVASAAVVLLSGTSLITPEHIAAQLTRFGNYVATSAEARGKEGRFAYAGLDIQGWGYEKQGVIKNVTIELGEKSLLDTTKWTFSTASVGVRSDSASASRLFFECAEPINIIFNGQLKTTLTGTSPIRYGVLEGQQNGQVFVQHTLALPPQLLFTFPAPVGEENEQHRRTILSYDAGPLLSIQDMPVGNTREVKAQFNHLKMVGSDGTLASADVVSGQMQETINDENKIDGRYSATVSGFSLGAGSTAGKPYNMNASFRYSGDRAGLDITTLLPMMGTDAQMTLDTLSLVADNFTMNAQGNLATSLDDPLPHGAVDITIENAGNFIGSDLIPDHVRNGVLMVLEKISGQTLMPESRVVIALKREKNGVFYVGNVTFEELTASLLKDILLARPPEPPVLPPIEEPAPQPLPQVQ